MGYEISGIAGIAVALPSFAYGDPSRTAEIMQRRDCTGCKHHDRLWGAEWCNLEKWNGRDNMKRCEQYERGANGTDKA